MRVLTASLAALLLASCGSNDVPSPAEQLEGDAAEPVDPGQVTLRGDGLTAGAESFFFAAGENEVKVALANTLGAAETSGDMPECGAGPMNFASYPGGLTVNFQNGMVAGWVLGAKDDAITVSAEMAIGTPRPTLETISGYSLIEDSTLGEEFFISGGMAGFIEDDAVSMLYAGTQCFFR